MSDHTRTLASGLLGLLSFFVVLLLGGLIGVAVSSDHRGAYGVLALVAAVGVLVMAFLTPDPGWPDRDSPTPAAESPVGGFLNLRRARLLTMRGFHRGYLDDRVTDMRRAAPSSFAELQLLATGRRPFVQLSYGVV